MSGCWGEWWPWTSPSRLPGAPPALLHAQGSGSAQPRAASMSQGCCRGPALQPHHSRANPQLASPFPQRHLGMPQLPSLPCSLNAGTRLVMLRVDPSHLLVPASSSAPGTAQCIGRVCIPLFSTGGSSQSRALKQLIFNSVLSPSYFPFMEHCIVVCYLKTDLNKATLLSNLQEIWIIHKS